MRSKINKKSSGFTLIEIIIVVTILALLILLASSSFLKNIFLGNDARKKADLNKIKIYIEEYEKDHDCYPTAESMALCGSSSLIAIHPYLSNVPCNPLTKEPYAYEPDPDNTSCPSWFRLYADLQNEKDPKIITEIGPDSAYNYYVSSDNAPSPERCADSGRYGCFGDVCKKICEDDCTIFFDAESACIGSCHIGSPSQCVKPN